MDPGALDLWLGIILLRFCGSAVSQPFFSYTQNTTDITFVPPLTLGMFILATSDYTLLPPFLRSRVPAGAIAADCGSQSMSGLWPGHGAAIGTDKGVLTGHPWTGSDGKGS